ncbi:MAG: RDD family protein [Clostridia bacterium]|nr:RDD family protein [Clostridia bacterium]
MGYEIASAKKRFMAFVIDGVLNLAVFIFSISYSSYVQVSSPLWIILGINIALIATKMSYWAAGTTYGKSYMHLQIVDHDTRRPLCFKKMMMRQTIGMMISFMVLNIGIIWIVIDRERQGWHDKMFHDLVIDLNRPVEIVEEDEYIHGY